MSVENKRIFAIAVQKGGVGKTTKANAIAYRMAEQGYKTVLVDFDDQATQTSSFMGFRNKNAFAGDDRSNITNLFYNKEVVPLKIGTVKFVDNPNRGKMHQPHYLEEKISLDFIPGNYELLDVLEGDEFTREVKIEAIHKYLIGLASIYDKVIVDAPPSFGIVTTAILQSSEALLIPIPTKNVDTGGMVGFFDRLDAAYEKHDMSRLEKIVVLPNMYDKRVSDAKETLAVIRATPTIPQSSKNLRDIKCVVEEPFPQKSCVQEAPNYNMFLAHYIMMYDRKNIDLITKINEFVNELESE